MFGIREKGVFSGLRSQVGAEGKLESIRLPKSVLVDKKYKVKGTFVNISSVPSFFWVVINRKVNPSDEGYSDETEFSYNSPPIVLQEDEEESFEIVIEPVALGTEDITINLLCSPGGRDFLSRQLVKEEYTVSITKERVTLEQAELQEDTVVSAKERAEPQSDESIYDSSLSKFMRRGV